MQGDTILYKSSKYHKVYNSLQFFQRLVLLQCSGQSYGSSGGQKILADTVVEVMHAESDWWTTFHKLNCKSYASKQAMLS